MYQASCNKSNEGISTNRKFTKRLPQPSHTTRRHVIPFFWLYIIKVNNNIELALYTCDVLFVGDLQIFTDNVRYKPVGPCIPAWVTLKNWGGQDFTPIPWAEAIAPGLLSEKTKRWMTEFRIACIFTCATGQITSTKTFFLLVFIRRWSQASMYFPLADTGDINTGKRDTVVLEYLGGETNFLRPPGRLQNLSRMSESRVLATSVETGTF